MRLQGMTFQAIGDALGFTQQAAQKAITRSLEITKAEIAEKADELRAIEAERLEKITAVLWPKVLEGNLPAIDRVLRARESFRRLTGLDVQPGAGEPGPQIMVIESRPPWLRDEPGVIDGDVVEQLPASTADAG